MVQREFSVALSPLASFGGTKYGPIIDLWAQVGSALDHYRFSLDSLGTWNVTVDVSDVVAICKAAMVLEESGDATAFDARARRWVETGVPAKLRIVLEAPESSLASDENMHIILNAVWQELFIVLNMCTEGAGHLNRARCLEPESARDLRLGYYGDAIESAWVEAREWGWPKLSQLPFKSVWAWLEQSGFRNCSIASAPVHKALVTFLELAQHESLFEPLEVLLLAQSLETLMVGGSGSIGKMLKNRIHLVLGEPTSHKKWITDFYNLRSRIIHGDYPLVRSGVIQEAESVEYSQKFWRPLDRAIAVLIGLLQNLIVNNSMGFCFEERFSYVPIYGFWQKT